MCKTTYLHSTTALIIESHLSLTILCVTLSVENDENVTEERWFDKVNGRNGLNLWLKIDGKIIVEGTDPDIMGLPDGKLFSGFAESRTV